MTRDQNVFRQPSLFVSLSPQPPLPASLGGEGESEIATCLRQRKHAVTTKLPLSPQRSGERGLGGEGSKQRGLLLAAFATLATFAFILRPTYAAEPPEIGEVLRASGPVYYLPVGAGKFDARTGDPLHPGDRLTVGPGGSAVICFYQTGLRYRLSVAKGRAPATLPIAANGREDLVTHPASLRCQPLATIVATVAQRLSPKARARFGPLKASSGIRDLFSRVPLDNDALSDAAAPATLAYRGPLPTMDSGQRLALTLTESPGASSQKSEKTVVWKSAPLAADSLNAPIPAGTLRDGARYRWELTRLPGAASDSEAAAPPMSPMPPIKSGYLWTLTSAQRTEMQGVIADARKTPLTDPTDPDPLILEAGIYHTYGLETLAADTYRAALNRGPVNTALRRQLVPLTQRGIVAREGAAAEPWDRQN